MSTDSLKGIRALHDQLASVRKLQVQLAPSLALQKQMEAFTTTHRLFMRQFAPDQTVLRAAFEAHDRLRELRAGALAVSAILNTAYQQIQRAAAPLASTLRAVGRVYATCRRIEAAGWLPHYTVPFETIAALTDEESVHELLQAHYSENWPQIEADFLSRLEGYDIDDEAKAAFREALACHRQGLYRPAIRTVFPELERVAREELYDGQLEGITSLRDLRDRADELTLGDVEPGGLYAMGLFTKLLEHFYAPVKTFEQLAEVAADPTPNRHAAMHGLVSYRDQRSSVNALIMADFIFQVICALKAAQSDALDVDAA